MILYHSAVTSYLEYMQEMVEGYSFNILFPFDLLLSEKTGRVNQKSLHNWFKKLSDFKKVVGCKVFLDCGAFSAYQRGFTIDLLEYISFLHDYGGFFETITALDVINDSEVTWKNYYIMREAGLGRAIPVYHIGEPYSALVRLGSEVDYLGFSPPTRLHFQEFRPLCISSLYNNDGQFNYRDKKFHGFGIGDPQFFELYPWYSCDTTTPATQARYGKILIPKIENGIFDDWYLFFVSSVSKKRKDHYIHLRKPLQRYIDDLVGRFGFKISDFDEDQFSFGDDLKRTEIIVRRTLFNIRMFKEFYIRDAIENSLFQPTLL